MASHEKMRSFKDLPMSKLKEMCQEADFEDSGTKIDLLMRLCGMDKEKPNTDMSVMEVNEWLESQDVDDIDSVSKCLRAGIQRRFIDISGYSPLDNLVGTGKCPECEYDVKATIRDLLYQPDYAGLDYENGGDEAPLKCPSDQCDQGVYVTGMCRNCIRTNSGKQHNHCTSCPGFGQCLGDYRQEHCKSCDEHYYAGAGMLFNCPCRGSSCSDDDYF